MHREPQRLALVGTGKLAQNIGLFFLKAGWRVDWLTRDPQRLASASAELGKQVRRALLTQDTPDLAERWSLCVLGDYAAMPDLILESSSEDLGKKQAIAAVLAQKFPAAIPRCSNSSSILPNQIGPAWLGLHWFYPVELSAFVELIIPPGIDPAQVTKLEGILDSLALRVIRQSLANAFCVNRLLLPIQASALATLKQGYAAEAVEAASITPFIPIGTLSTIDAIGLELVLAAVKNYLTRATDPVEAQACMTIMSVLADAIRLGKRGGKSGEGLVKGNALPWFRPEIGLPRANDFWQVLIGTMASAVNSAMISLEDLEFLVRDYWGGQWDRQVILN